MGAGIVRWGGAGCRPGWTRDRAGYVDTCAGVHAGVERVWYLKVKEIKWRDICKNLQDVGDQNKSRVFVCSRRRFMTTAANRQNNAVRSTDAGGDLGDREAKQTKYPLTDPVKSP